MSTPLDKDQQKALDLMLNGYNVFLTGGAGTGKSLIINEFRRICDYSPVCLAPTGLAALNIGGSTIHSFFGVVCNVFDPNQLKAISVEQLKRFRAIKTIIFDEGSMIRADMFQYIDALLRSISDEAGSQLPFGGKQIIVSGDFFQLPPVVPEWQIEQYLNSLYGGIYCFNSEAWENAQFKAINLKKVYRQSDPDFMRILNAIRVGDIIGARNSEYMELINNNNYIDEFNQLCSASPALPDNALCITTTRKIADGINTQRFNNLPGPSYYFQASRSGYFPHEKVPTSYMLEIKIGMRVMLLNNKYSLNGTTEYVNGDTGIVEHCETGDEPYVIVKLDNGKTVRVESYVWQNHEYELGIDSNGDDIVKQKITGIFQQLPLAPGYAITIHKSQGKTLNLVRILLGNRPCFVPGQLYTALSRCRTITGVNLDRPIEPSDIIINHEVRKFYDAINTQNN